MIVSEQQLPLPAIKLTATYGSISRKDIDEAIAEVQESSDISDGAKNVLAKASKLLAAVPALSHPSAAPEATASPTDLATTDANKKKLEQQLEGLDEIATLRAKLAAFELKDQLPPGWVSGVFSVFNIRFIVR